MEEIVIAMSLLGFEPAEQSRLRHILPRINCEGLTAFRDAVLKGNELMLQLFTMFLKVGIHEKFQFVHVVLTDGADCASQISHEDFLKYQLYINSQLPPQILKTFYIGVGLENDYNVRQQMLQIIKCSDESAQYYPIHSNGINDIFQKIQMQIGIQIQQRGLLIQNDQMTIGVMQQQCKPIVQLQVNNYIVLFTLDISGSMSSNWPKVCNAVSSFLDNLGQGDLVLGITFNDAVSIVTMSQELKNQINRKPQISYNSQQNYQQQYQQKQQTQKDSIVTNEDYCCKIF